MSKILMATVLGLTLFVWNPFNFHPYTNQFNSLVFGKLAPPNVSKVFAVHGHVDTTAKLIPLLSCYINLSDAGFEMVERRAYGTYQEYDSYKNSTVEPLIGSCKAAINASRVTKIR